MPLPANQTAWPPAELDQMRAKWDEWSAWYSSDTDALTDVYTSADADATRDGLARRAAKAVVRFFWGEKRRDLTKPAERKLHVPVAADLCQASADLLFSEPPTIRLDVPVVVGQDGKPAPEPENVARTRERLEEITGPALHKALASGAETAAALGGVYLRAMWDTSVAQHAFVTVVDYDAAWPEFRWGRLVAITFWSVVGRNGQTVIRHLERHELDNLGVGVIFHGLYEGTDSNLGRAVPLTEHPATADLATEVDEESKISTLSPGLDVFHWENSTPNRRWRKHPLGKHLGRSDLDGIEPLMDAIDEAYTSLMRDVRLGKSMIIVPRGMLDSNGAGEGASFAQDEVYSPINAAPGSAADSKLAIEKVQFSIRVQEHEQTIGILWAQLIRSAGYSAQTFGEGSSVAATATEVWSKDRRSALSQGRKGRVVEPVLMDLVKKLLAIDAAVFRSGVDTSLPVDVELADGVQPDVEALARTAQLLSAAVAASIETRVRLVNPDKDETWIGEEVERIKAENQLEPLADPDTLGVDGAGLSGQFGGGEDGDTGDGEA
ncbi:hypothetical protein GCM10023081_46860 [Arthrobacter ginkgonis]|uniref:Phage portal protein n=1 Tax=Arthrobacter ginkgonis TaxID=1630594 RepID=A0ABP7DHC2_9MICC